MAKQRKQISQSEQARRSQQSDRSKYGLPHVQPGETTSQYVPTEDNRSLLRIWLTGFWWIIPALLARAIYRAYQKAKGVSDSPTQSTEQLER